MLTVNITFDFGEGKTSFFFLCETIDLMRDTKGPAACFNGILDPATWGAADIPIEEVVDSNGLSQKFSYNTDLFGKRFAAVKCSDICSMAVSSCDADSEVEREGVVR